MKRVQEMLGIGCLVIVGVQLALVGWYFSASMFIGSEEAQHQQGDFWFASMLQDKRLDSRTETMQAEISLLRQQNQELTQRIQEYQTRATQISAQPQNSAVRR